MIEMEVMAACERSLLAKIEVFLWSYCGEETRIPRRKPISVQCGDQTVHHRPSWTTISILTADVFDSYFCRVDKYGQCFSLEIVQGCDLDPYRDLFQGQIIARKHVGMFGVHVLC